MKQIVKDIGEHLLQIYCVIGLGIVVIGFTTADVNLKLWVFNIIWFVLCLVIAAFPVSLYCMATPSDEEIEERKKYIERWGGAT